MVFECIEAFYSTIRSDAKAFIHGTYHSLPKQNLQAYLDEFCFGRRGFGGRLFDRLALAMVGVPLAESGV